MLRQLRMVSWSNCTVSMCWSLQWMSCWEHAIETLALGDVGTITPVGPKYKKGSRIPKNSQLAWPRGLGPWGQDQIWRYKLGGPGKLWTNYNNYLTEMTWMNSWLSASICAQVHYNPWINEHEASTWNMYMMMFCTKHQHLSTNIWTPKMGSWHFSGMGHMAQIGQNGFLAFFGHFSGRAQIGPNGLLVFFGHFSGRAQVCTYWNRGQVSEYYEVRNFKQKLI